MVDIKIDNKLYGCHPDVHSERTVSDFHDRRRRGYLSGGRYLPHVMLGLRRLGQGKVIGAHFCVTWVDPGR